MYSNSSNERFLEVQKFSNFHDLSRLKNLLYSNLYAFESFEKFSKGFERLSLNNTTQKQKDLAHDP